MTFPRVVDNPPIRQPHTISREKFIAVLQSLRSPAAAEAHLLADIPDRWGLDRGIALGFFAHESSAGKKGIAREYDTRNWGNLRRVQHSSRGVNIQTRGGQFARYHSWSAGLTDWCDLLVSTYERRWGLTTLGEILQKYAPREDRNDPVAYASKVVKHIRDWQREEVGPVLVEVTATAGLNIRAGRGANTAKRGALPFGERVWVSDEGGGWARLLDGRGYIAAGWTRAVL